MSGSQGSVLDNLTITAENLGFWSALFRGLNHILEHAQAGTRTGTQPRKIWLICSYGMFLTIFYEAGFQLDIWLVLDWSSYDIALYGHMLSFLFISADLTSSNRLPTIKKYHFLKIILSDNIPDLFTK